MPIEPNVLVFPVPGDARDPAAARSSIASSASGVERSEAGATLAAKAAEAATTGRLQTLRAMVDRGDYPVDLDRLASRIADEELRRGGRS